MKIIHLSDPHIEPDILFGIDSIDRFTSAITHISNNHADADLFIISGDLTHYGKKESYRELDKILKKLNLPQHLYPKLMVGNHDDRINFKKIFLNTPQDENGFIQYFEDIGNKRFIFLDTNLKDTDQGHFCEKRQEWLINVLKNNQNKSVYLFMHHNPLPTGYLSSDEIGLKQRNEFKSIINSNSNIKHIFFGHQHITTSGNYLGIPFSSPRSTWSPLIPNFSENFRLGTAHTEPNYNIVLIRDDSLVVHTEDFLKTNIQWFEK